MAMAMAIADAAGGVLRICAATSRPLHFSNPIEQGRGGGRESATCPKAASDDVSSISEHRGARLEALAVKGCNNATCRFAIARDSARGEEVGLGVQGQRREKAEGKDMQRGYLRLMTRGRDRGRRGGLGRRHVANAWRPVGLFPAAGQLSLAYRSSAPYPAAATSAPYPAAATSAPYPTTATSAAYPATATSAKQPKNRVSDRLARGEMMQRSRSRPNLSSRSQLEDDEGMTEQMEPLDLSEENINTVLLEARTELLQIFDTSVGITGIAELADLDGPFVTLRLTGRFWHQRSVVLARLANYMRKRIPEILEVEIEDEGQLSD